MRHGAGRPTGEDGGCDRGGPDRDPAQAALRWSARPGTKDPMAPAHVTSTPSGSGPGAPGTRAGDRARPEPPARRGRRSWERLRAFDRRYATYVDLALAAGLFVVCSGWVLEPRHGAELVVGRRPDPPLDLRRRAPMTVFLVIAAVAFMQWLVTGPGPGRRRAPRRARHRRARVRLGPRRRGRGDPRGRDRHGHRALAPTGNDLKSLRVPHRPGLHGPLGRASCARRCAASSTGWPSGPSASRSSATSRRRWPPPRSGRASRGRCTTSSRTTSR